MEKEEEEEAVFTLEEGVVVFTREIEADRLDTQHAGGGEVGGAGGWLDS